MAKLNFKTSDVAKNRAPVDVARSYIAAGIPVFPCREGTTEGIDYATGEIVEFVEKSPYTSDGLKGATTSSRIVNILFGERNVAAAIGVPTGEKLGAWVLDLDRHGDRDGHKWLEEMEAIHGALPYTPRAKTANGGTHIFFKHVEGIRNRAAIAPGVDTRGDGGYILAPGSVMADGRRYEWIDWHADSVPDFADAPAWLIDLVKPRQAASVTAQSFDYQAASNERYVEVSFDDELRILANHAVGGRGAQVNASAYNLGRFVGAGLLSRSEAEAGLWAAAQANGVVTKDGEREIRAKIRRGLDSGILNPKHIPEREYHNDNTPVDSERISRMAKNTLERKLREEAGDNQPEPEQPISTQPAQPKKRERFDLTWFDEIEEGKPKETILKGWLGVGEFTTISGLPGTGKSVIVTDIACHIAAGMDWHGKKVKQGLVVYVAAERKKLTERRMMAFRQHHDVHDVPLLVVGGRLDFTKDLKDARDLIAAIRDAETITGLPCVWVIIDTLTRVFGGGDQNASKDMTRFVQSCDEILTETKAHVTAIHHSAWSGERGKGAIDLDGAVDASFMVKKEGGKHRLVCDGTNDGEDGDVLTFTMKSVQIGADEDGEPTTAPVVVECEMDAGERLVANVSRKEAEALDILKSLQRDAGTESPGAPHYPDDIMIVREEEWRQAVYATAKPETPQGTKQQNFNRAKKSLKGKGAILENGQWVWAA